ncbi:hypothetical protein ACQZ6F_01165 [Rhizobium sp. A22-96]
MSTDACIRPAWTTREKRHGRPGHKQRKDHEKWLAFLPTKVASASPLRYTVAMIRISAALVGISIAGPVLAGQGQVVQSGDKIQDCSNAADQVLSKTKGRLLSVKPRENRCIVTVIVPHSGNRPEKIVVPVDFTDTDSNQDNGQ